MMGWWNGLGRAGPARATRVETKAGRVAELAGPDQPAGGGAAPLWGSGARGQEDGAGDSVGVGAYLTNPVAQRCVRLVAEAVGAAPIRASDDALAALVGRTAGGQRLTETVAAQLQLHGAAYVQLLKDGSGAVRDLYALAPERVRVVADATGWPAAYRYQVGRHVRELAAAPPPGSGGEAGAAARSAEVIAIRTYHPSNDHAGASALKAAAGAIATHRAAGAWNRALLANAARPSGALTVGGEKTGPMTDAQFERMRAEMAAAFQGAGNAGRPLLLEGDLRWQPLSLTPADMDHQALTAGAAREIALAFGVPPMLIGLPGDATYANYREAGLALWRLTVLPLAGRVLDALAEGLAPWWPGARLAVDLDRVPALAADREALWAQVGRADWLAPDEKRAILGL